jgi:hypothetical protein
VYPSGIDSNCNIDAIVDEKWHIVAVAENLGFLRDVEELGSARFNDYLNEAVGPSLPLYRLAFL